MRHGLARVRKSAGFTQETLAEFLVVAPSAVGRWERGVAEPGPLLRPRLAVALGIGRWQLHSLLYGSEDASALVATSAYKGRSRV